MEKLREFFYSIFNFFGATGTGNIFKPEPNTFAKRIQKAIYLFMSNRDNLYFVTHIKYGGSSGVPGNMYTNKIVILHKALEMLNELPARPTGENDFQQWIDDVVSVGVSVDDYKYPGIESLSNNDTTNGFKRDRPDIWEAITRWVEENLDIVVQLVASLISSSEEPE